MLFRFKVEDITDEEARDRIKKLRMRPKMTPAERESLMAALKRAGEAAAKFREDAKVDPATLRIPFDV